jgi:hypothetical protein
VKIRALPPVANRHERYGPTSPRASNGDSICILVGRSETVKPPVDPSPAGTKSTVNNVMTGNS